MDTDDELRVLLSSMERNELLGVMWEQMGVRPSPNCSLDDMLAVANLEASVGLVHDRGPVNKMRRELIGFIRDNETELSLECDGDCYKHSDGVVIHCWNQLQRDLLNVNKLKKIKDKLNNG